VIGHCFIPVIELSASRARLMPVKGLRSAFPGSPRPLAQIIHFLRRVVGDEKQCGFQANFIEIGNFGGVVKA
jgi:hypothetical protein